MPGKTELNCVSSVQGKERSWRWSRDGGGGGGGGRYIWDDKVVGCKVRLN